MKDTLTKEEKIVIREMAERCAGVSPGGKGGRWTHEGRVVVVYSVLCSLYRLSRRKKIKKIL